MVLAVVVMSLIPRPPHLGHFRNNDKVSHFTAYVAMMFWFSQIFTRNLSRARIALALIMLGAQGCSARCCWRKRHFPGRWR